MLALVTFLAIGAHGFSFGSLYNKYMPPVYDDSCHFTRVDALECFVKYVDVDPRDGGISPHEAQLAIQRFSTPPIQALFWGWGTKQLFKACDKDGNGVITPKDWMASQKTCMPHKRNLCSIEWFCKRAENAMKPPRV